MIRQPRQDELELLTDLAVEHAHDAGLNEHDQVDRRHTKRQWKQVMINPDYVVFVVIQNNKFVGYSLSSVCEKLWNTTLHGEIINFYISPEVRNKYVADDLYNTTVTDLMEKGCVYLQASCLMYDKDYQPNEQWLHRAKTFFKSKGLAEVGYHYVRKLEGEEWAA